MRFVSQDNAAVYRCVYSNSTGEKFLESTDFFVYLFIIIIIFSFFAIIPRWFSRCTRLEAVIYYFITYSCSRVYVFYANIRI